MIRNYEGVLMVGVEVFNQSEVVDKGDISQKGDGRW